MKDEFGFLEKVENWCNHRVLLLPALETAKLMDGISPVVIEFGSGWGSTSLLRQYCEDEGLTFKTYDHDKGWATSTGSTHVDSWDDDDLYEECRVVLIDHAPGEHRHIAIERFKDKAKFIVIHDSEPAATGYMLHKIWHHFPYRYDFQTDGAWATVVSRFVDVSTEIPAALKLIKEVGDE